MGLAKGRLILCLEGGYNVRAISYAMAMCTKALLGDPIVHNSESKNPPHPSAIESINNVISVQKKHWNNLSFQVALPKEDVLPLPEPSRGLDVKPIVNDFDKPQTNDDCIDSLTNSIDKMNVKCDDNSGNENKNNLPSSSSSGNQQENVPQPGNDQVPTLSEYLSDNLQVSNVIILNLLKNFFNLFCYC